jgi:hypothetical protein
MSSPSVAQNLALTTTPPRLVIVPDIQPFLAKSWNEQVITTIMEARSASSKVEVIIAAPTLTLDKLFPETLYRTLIKWSRNNRTGLSVNAKRHDDVALYDIQFSFEDQVTVCLVTSEHFALFGGDTHKAWAQLITEDIGLDPSMRESALHLIGSENNTVLFPGAPSDHNEYPFREFCVVELVHGRVRYRMFEAGKYGS